MTKLGGVVLFVKDVERMKTFYKTALDLAVLEEEEGWVKFGSRDGFFALHAIPPAFASEVEISDPPKVRAGSPMKPVFRVTDVAALREALCRRGVNMMNPNLSESGETVRCDGVDPEGNVFQIAR